MRLLNGWSLPNSPQPPAPGSPSLFPLQPRPSRVPPRTGTPTEESCPGVSSLPDFQPVFPCWPSKPLRRPAPTFGDDALDLLAHMLEFDPHKRLRVRANPSPHAGAQACGCAHAPPRHAPTHSPIAHARCPLGQPWRCQAVSPLPVLGGCARLSALARGSPTDAQAEPLLVLEGPTPVYSGARNSLGHAPGSAHRSLALRRTRRSSTRTSTTCVTWSTCPP